MNNPNTLDDFYRYWDEFYVAWCHCNKTKIKLLGWDIPKFLGGCPNEHEVSKKYKTIDLLPEPWWGNSGGMDQPLKSVVINFNPGSGGEKQLRKNFSCSYRYSRYVTDQVNKYVNSGNSKSICATSNWHHVNRAKRIYETLKCHKYNNYNNYDLRNHLSVELVPWHSVSSNDIIEYCAKNRKAIFDYCIKFAAAASIKIQNPILSGVVLLRMSSSFFKQIMGGIGGLNYLLEEHAIYKKENSQSCKNTTNPSNSLNNDSQNLVVKSIKELDHKLIKKVEAYYCLFEFSSIPGVKFACIWGPKTRNNFPGSDCMKEIIKQITIFKLTNL